MSNEIENGNLIIRIRNGESLEEISAYARERLFKDGPTDTVVLEILSYLKLFQPEYFSTFEIEIIETMGLFFKQPEPDTLRGAIFDLYSQYIKDQFGESYTPMQANIIKQIRSKQFFSFSAPTSTGKSFVFRNLIKNSSHDVVVIVPSRALINEYYDRVHEIISSKNVNILTFVDRINTKHSTRNVFILTPERARDLFKNKSWLNIEIVLFDEAQLSDEESVRGLYFDSIVRRVLKTFPQAKCIFAHPFITNPQAQLKKNKIDLDEASFAQQYQQKNVGQLFYIHDTKINEFYHLGMDKEIMGKQKVQAHFDPIHRAIESGGSVLIYVPKKHIYDKSIYSQFEKYINMCLPLQDKEAVQMVEALRKYIGASKDDKQFYNSEMLEKLSCGIVTHHGSMPLAARLILEHFTQKRFCRICFATSTLEQGINMPFDVVYLDRFEASASLSVKNLIGRAGRSTSYRVFDYGSVIVRKSAMNALRKTIKKEEPLSEISHLDIIEDKFDEKYNEFKEAIKNDSFSDDYNLTNADVEKLKSEDVTILIPTLLDMMFQDDHIADPRSEDGEDLKEVYADFHKLYEYYLGRSLEMSEKTVLSNAIKIMLWKVYGRTFRTICQFRYAYASRLKERKNFYKKGDDKSAEELNVQYLRGYHDIPDKNLNNYPLFDKDLKAKDVDYDLIVYDTYDYLDKLIGFKLSDIYYAIFHQYYKENQDERALRLAKYFKYGTDDSDEIWMLRYGLTFEDIEWAKPCIIRIDESEIIFNNKISSLEKEQLRTLEQFIHPDVIE
ncbi:helicase [Paenibacillus odorifer]|uniref:DEAD/DEAH box helicase n=1 Tax=Paenibacillus odorifer TaxID=189426 RepID=UPI00096C5938|nr:DEAD/DEAH box helicase [Paenibacillus odorifer]OMD89325.1 helicase [Paenibacillus odorifer]